MGNTIIENPIQFREAVAKNPADDPAKNPADFLSRLQRKNHNSQESSTESVLSTTPDASRRCSEESQCATEEKSQCAVEEKKLGIPVGLLNVLLLGFGFLMNMGPCLTTIIAQTVVLNSVFNDSTMGYILLAINCGVQAITYLFGPAMCLLIGPKSTLVAGGVATSLCIAVYIQPIYGLMYPSAVLSGFSVGASWSVPCYFLRVNSTKKTLERNTGIFWGLFQTSLVTWSVFYFLMLRGQPKIDDYTRKIVFSVLLCGSVVGIIIFALILHPWNAVEYKKSQKENEMSTKILEILVSTIRIGFTKKMLLLWPTFLYVGLSLTFWSNVYSTTLGYTEAFGNMKDSLVGLAGVFVGVGEISAALMLGFFGRWSSHNGRDVGLFLALIIHYVAFYLIFLNVPARSSLEMTNDLSYIGEPNPYLAMFCAALVGFGDSIWNNMVIAHLAVVYPHETVPAFGFQQFITAIGNGIMFGYSTVLALPYMLLIMIIVIIPAFFGFAYRDWKTAPKKEPTSANQAAI